MRIRHLASVILIAIIAASCSQESADESLELYHLATNAEAFFKADDASASLVNDRRLILSLVNCNAGRLPGSERQYAAHEVALWTKRSYRNSGKLASISVVFVERHWLLFFWTSMSERFDFAVKGLEQVPMPSSDK
ncbi:MAG TPA: hypothetical protein VGQ21_14790 [Thermoanaerobaculia bacterium]|jgi:hypothetical protein|nr:hypothetical protein [Thermoanaerobaculia bacterium]